MTQRNDGGPAFARAGFSGPAGFGRPVVGMSLRQYAAISLRVPDSGTDWLDDMIRQSARDEFAGKALAGLGGRKFHKGDAGEGYAEWAASMAYEFADALLAARERT